MKGPLETGLHRMEQGRQGERDGQTEGGMTKIRGRNPAGVRQTRGAGEIEGKEKAEGGGGDGDGGGQNKLGKQGQDRQTGSEWGEPETDRQMAGTRGCPRLPAFSVFTS